MRPAGFEPATYGFEVPHGMVGLMAPVFLHVQYIGNGFARQAKNMPRNAPVGLFFLIFFLLGADMGRRNTCKHLIFTNG